MDGKFDNLNRSNFIQDIDADTLRNVNEFMVACASKYLNRGKDVPRRVYAVGLTPNGEVARCCSVPMNIVTTYSALPNGGLDLQRFINSALESGTSLNTQIQRQLMAAPNLIVEVAEAWASSESIQSGVRASQAKDRIELLVIRVFASCGATMTSYRIARDGFRKSLRAMQWAEMLRTGTTV